MRTKVTLVLLFLNVVLFFFIYQRQDQIRIDEQKRTAGQKVLDAEATNVARIEISGRTLPQPISLVQEGDIWQLTSPVAWPANPHAVAGIISKLQFLEHETSFPVSEVEATGQTLADYGLADPALTISFDAGEGTPRYSLRVGDETLAGNRFYVLSPDGTRIHVVDQSLAEIMTQSLAQLRADALFTIQLFEVRSLNLQTATPANLKIRLRREGNRWTFETPFVARAQRNATEATIIALNSLRAQAFPNVSTLDPARIGLANPQLRITLEGNNRRETLLLGQPVPSATPGTPIGDEPRSAPPAGTTTDAKAETLYYAQMDGRPTIVTVNMPEILLTVLRNAQQKLRDPIVLDLAGRTISTISITSPNEAGLTLQRLDRVNGEQDNWQVIPRSTEQGPQALPADRAIVERLIENLSYLAADSFESDAPREADLEEWGFPQPEREITLGLTGNVATPGAPTVITLQLAVANETEGRVRARILNQPFVYLVPPQILRAVPAVPRAYRERLLSTVPDEARITKLQLFDLKTSQSVVDTSLTAGANWATTWADLAPARREALNALRLALRRLEAVNFVGDGFTPTPILGERETAWRYRLTATWAMGDEEETHDIVLFASERIGGDSQVIGSPEFNALFTPTQAVIDAFWTLTYGKRDPGPPPNPPAPTTNDSR